MYVTEKKTSNEYKFIKDDIVGGIVLKPFNLKGEPTKTMYQYTYNK